MCFFLHLEMFLVSYTSHLLFLCVNCYVFFYRVCFRTYIVFEYMKFVVIILSAFVFTCVCFVTFTNIQLKDIDFTLINRSRNREMKKRQLFGRIEKRASLIFRFIAGNGLSKNYRFTIITFDIHTHTLAQEILIRIWK